MWVVAAALLATGFTTQAPRRTVCRQPRVRVALTSADDEAKLVAECRKEERSLAVIQGLVEVLAAEPPAAKPKRELLGDWSLEFVSDADAVVPVTSGEIGKFATIEGVVHRLQKDNLVETIEVARQFGPFGNARRALNGKWSVEKTPTETMVRWRYSYMIDQYGRERDPPSAQQEAGTQEVKLSYVSGGLMLLAIGEGSSVLVFSKVPNLTEWLEENRVATEGELKEKAEVA